MKYTIQTSSRKVEQLNRSKDAEMKIITLLKVVFSSVLFGAVIYGFIAIPSYIHSRHCDGCNWFWCNNYNGQGDI